MGRKKTPIKEVDAILAERGIERAGPYIGTTQKPTPLRCGTCDHEWNASISNIKIGGGCPTCAGNARLTIEQVDAILAERGFERAGPYPRSVLKPTPLRCGTCAHEWNARITNIKQGSGCPACHAEKTFLSVEQVDAILTERGFERAGPYIGTTHKPTPLRCGACSNEWNANINNIKRGNGCPSCARDPWQPQGVYILRDPDTNIPYQYIGISWKPSLRLLAHQEDKGDRGRLARMLDAPDELTYGDVYEDLDVMWESQKLSEDVLNWFEQNPHGKLPPGRLWFFEWDRMTKAQSKQPARLPKFVAKKVESFLITEASPRTEPDNPFSAAGRFPLVNAAEY